MDKRAVLDIIDKFIKKEFSKSNKAECYHHCWTRLEQLKREIQKLEE